MRGAPGAILGVIGTVATLTLLGGEAAAQAPTRTYEIYVCAESQDEVARVRFGPAGLEVVATISVGSFPAETEGPHGIRVAPDGRHWYVSMAHGLPYGSVHKYETGTDLWVGDATLGLFPATLDLTATTGLLYAANFNLHGAMQPSTISIVETDTMTEVEQVVTGVMPHGSRLSPDGEWHYSVAMMDHRLFEIDALGFEVTRTLDLGDGVQPTWVTTPTADGRLYVTGQGVDRVFEVDLERWAVVRTFPTGSGPYNLAVTPDGRTLVVTYKREHAVGFWSLETGEEHARTPTSRTIPHGVVVTPDGAYAFVTLEGVGGEPGTVEVYAVETGRRLAAVDVGAQAGGLAFWRMSD